MPRININEKDRTSPGTPGGYSNNTVLIAGFSAYSEEEIKAMQDENKKLAEENKSLKEENSNLKTKNEEQVSAIKELKDDVAKFKEEVKQEFAKTQEIIPNAQDSKPKSLLEAIIDAN